MITPDRSWLGLAKRPDRQEVPSVSWARSDVCVCVTGFILQK
jgi:hypothetical protein